MLTLENAPRTITPIRVAFAGNNHAAIDTYVNHIHDTFGLPRCPVSDTDIAAEFGFDDPADMSRAWTRIYDTTFARYNDRKRAATAAVGLEPGPTPENSMGHRLYPRILQRRLVWMRRVAVIGGVSPQTIVDDIVNWTLFAPTMAIPLVIKSAIQVGAKDYDVIALPAATLPRDTPNREEIADWMIRRILAGIPEMSAKILHLPASHTAALDVLDTKILEVSATKGRE